MANTPIKISLGL